ncbi:MAG: Fis family transcriptional regulator [Verrucomicrobia bacterium]|nr:MAG: Fis family transcriptional regulator [Verrucomicrobiota bacterium]
MSADVLIQGETQRYQAVLRISEALFACQTCEELARILADQLGKVLSFDDLEVIVFKENSKEIEWQVCAKGRLGAPEAPVEELPAWHVYDSQDTLLINDWKADERFPRLKELVAKTDIDIGSVVRVPLMTPHQRLGTLGIASRPGTTYSADDIGFLRLIARVVALAIEDRLNLTKEQEARAELQRQNDRLQLLLNVTNRITSNLGLRELLRAVSANIREVMHGDVVAISLPDAAPGQFRVFAMDFPHGKGFAREELLVMQPAKDLLDSMKPVVVDWRESEGFPSEAYAIAAAEGVKLSCIIPLVNHGRVLGRLSISRRTETSFTPDEVEFLSQISGQIAIAVENALAYREISELKDKLAQEKLYLEEEIRSEMNFEQIIGNSSALKHVLQLVETVAPSDSTVLLLGETGTGKELIARAIHDRSQRKDRTLVKLNCAAIPTGLLESELFGHEKGAFTGAISQKIGRLELANQGTLFLDEVGDIPAEIQPKLLRALQEREFERLGSTHTRKVNVRLVAATNRDLEKMIAAREFRQDLFYRLNVFPIRIPPLRERREDIPLLVSYFVQRLAKQMQKKIEAIPTAVMKGLTAWEWPGNIRELENFIERAVILTRGKSLEAPLAELRKLNRDEPTHPAAQQTHEDIARIVKETINALSNKKSVPDEHVKQQRDEIVRALTESKGRVGGADGAAARMGMNRTTLLSRMKKLGIDPKQYA